MTLSPTTQSVDPRLLRAYRLAGAAGQWLKCRDKQGRPVAFAVPSSNGNGRYYLVNTRRCECPSFQYHGDCKHRIAVAIHCERCQAEKQQKGTAA